MLISYNIVVILVNKIVYMRFPKKKKRNWENESWGPYTPYIKKKYIKIKEILFWILMQLYLRCVIGLFYALVDAGLWFVLYFTWIGLDVCDSPVVRSLDWGSLACEGWLIACLDYIAQTNFRVAHIFREGNAIASMLVEPKRESSIWFWTIPSIESLVYLDFYGNGYFHFDS